jgi:hypothetical protein
LDIRVDFDFDFDSSPYTRRFFSKEGIGKGREEGRWEKIPDFLNIFTFQQSINFQLTLEKILKLESKFKVNESFIVPYTR